MKTSSTPAVVVFALLVGGVVPAASQQNRATEIVDAQGARIAVAAIFTGRFVNADVRDVLEMHGREASIEVRFDQNVTPIAPVTLTFEKAHVAEAFTSLLDIANLRVTVIDEKTVLVSRKTQ